MKFFSTIFSKITFFLLLSLSVFAQVDTNSVDIANAKASSAKYVFNFKKAPWYVRSTPFAIYTGAGKLSDKVTQNIEIGKSFNVIDLGIAFGRNSLRADTTLFLEGKVTMDVCNYGIFANEMTVGAGKVFDSQGSIMLELSYTIFAQIAPRFGVGITTGYYDFANEIFDSSRTFYGVYCRWGLQRTDTGGLLGIGRGRGRVGRAGHAHGGR